MNYLRPKITHAADALGAITVTIEWLTVDESSNVVKDEAGQPLVAYREVFKQLPTAAGKGYVSQVGCCEAQADLPPFFLDAKGLRHFVVTAEMDQMNLLGQEAKLTPRRQVAAAPSQS
jgi:hypothetical protein